MANDNPIPAIQPTRLKHLAAGGDSRNERGSGGIVILYRVGTKPGAARSYVQTADLTVKNDNTGRHHPQAE